MQHCRYKYSQQYGAPQSDITPVEAKQVSLSADGRTARITLGEMKAGVIYQLDLIGLISTGSRMIGHPTVCYTVNRLAQ